MIAVHEFDSTSEAYDASQTDDRIKDGDVLVVKRECAVAVLIQAWPIAIAPVNSGHSFHTSDEPFPWAEVPRTDDTIGDYSESLRVACAQLDGLPERKSYFVPSFGVSFRVLRGGPVRNDTRVRVNIDMYAMVELDRPQHEAQRDEWIQVLTDEEIAEWRAIGPEDRELFLTEEWAEKFAPQISTLGRGWVSFANTSLSANSRAR